MLILTRCAHTGTDERDFRQLLQYLRPGPFDMSLPVLFMKLTRNPVLKDFFWIIRHRSHTDLD